VQLSWKNPEKKRKRWVSIQTLGMNFWQQLGVFPSWMRVIENQWQLPQILSSAHVRQLLGLVANLQQVQQVFYETVDVMGSNDFKDLKSEVKPDSTDAAQVCSVCLQDPYYIYNWARQLQGQNVDIPRLPDMRDFAPVSSASHFPHLTGEQRQAELWNRKQFLKKNCYHLLDCVTVHVRSSQICISVPMLMQCHSWEAYNSEVTNGVAMALFDLWDLPNVEDSHLEKTCGRHKKIEVEGYGDGELHYFYEASCGSDRPAWLLEDHTTGAEVFHFYNAMGLSRQHEMMQSLLARIFVTKATRKFAHTVAISFLSHIAEIVPSVHFHYELISYDSEELEAEFKQALKEFQDRHPARLTPFETPFAPATDLALHLDANFPVAQDGG
jgi:hypothetical protein